MIRRSRQIHRPNQEIILADSITHVVYPRDSGKVVICGSHGGYSAAVLALQRHIKGVIFNDAGVGKENAGISRLTWLEENKIYGATIDANTARIGIGLETYHSGIVSHANALAGSIGISPGVSAAEAAQIILRCLGKQM